MEDSHAYPKMRIGRLQAPTLTNIWKSLDPGLNAAVGCDVIQKQYIPSNADSPLYRLISISHTEEPNENELEDPRDLQTRRQDFSFRNPSNPRGQSVPNLDREEIENHMPPRIVQSATNLLLDNGLTNTNHRRTSRSTLIGRSFSFISSSPKKKSNWMEEYSHIDIDWSMQAMDVLYNASFYDYIRDERNVDLSAIRLSRIIKDYKPKQVASALLWMIQGWSVENTSKLLRILFADWLPDLAGYSWCNISCVFSLISRGWPKNPQCCLCVAYILMSEPASSAALFLRSLTQNWDRNESVDIITYLDAVLKWDTVYLQEVMTLYSTVSPDEKSTSPVSSSYNEDLNLASQKLILANARLAMAEYQLALFTHWSNCAKCQSKEECEELTSLPVPYLTSLCEE